MKINFQPYIVSINHLKQYILKKPNAKKNLLFIHPFTGKFANKLAIFEKLTDYNIYGIEVAGHGASMNFNWDEINWFQYINQVYSFVCQEKLDQFTILSHSMGGGISFVIAYFLQEKVEKLITEGPVSPALYFKQDILKYLLPETIEEQIILLEKLVYDPEKIYGKNYQAKAFILLKESLQNKHLKKLLDFKEMQLVYNFLNQIIPKLNNNITIMLGERDDIIGTDQTLKYFQSLNNDKIEIILLEKTGHLISVEDPKSYNKIVLEKLKILN